MRVLAGLALVFLAGMVAAEAPDGKTRPMARQDAALVAMAERADRLALLRPMARPMKPSPNAFVETTDLLALDADGTMVVLSTSGMRRSLRPMLRPRAIVEQVMAKRRAQKRGAVCGDLALQGEAIGYVPGRINACGIKDAVRLRSVSGIALSQQAVIDCTTAKALKTWVERGVKPAIGTRGGGVAQLRVAAHYACRTRNNQPGAKVSEHGKGRAIDISGLRLKDGTQITVLRGWGSRSYGNALRKMRIAACGPFGTVLGPGSDGYHRDHFHFDTARYRSGAYCR
ncbi:extensin-like domain-containing protein [Primorskyibacter marinus]|uniref:extensin-like domain-containing protein n=1 Tax=Primorskyibacter marinus TaxID=1977320 RepID=UPI000E302549|nr:extensin family protein [Primorskyibacter marinus]